MCIMGRSNIMVCREKRDLYCLDHVVQKAGSTLFSSAHSEYSANRDHSVSMWRHVVWPPHIQSCPLEMGSDDNTKSEDVTIEDGEVK